MPSYLVQAYVPRWGGNELRAAVARVRTEAAATTAAGRSIKLLRSTFVPSDELCLLVFEAQSDEVVAEVAKRAALTLDRIVEAAE